MLKKIECEELISALPADRISDIDWENINEAEHLDSLTGYPIPNLSRLFWIRCLGGKAPLTGLVFWFLKRKSIHIRHPFSSTLFPDRAPHGKVLLTTFVGGERARSSIN